MAKKNKRTWLLNVIIQALRRMRQEDHETLL
jgi:hypothetical protein